MVAPLYQGAGRGLKQPLSACLLEYVILAHLKLAQQPLKPLISSHPPHYSSRAFHIRSSSGRRTRCLCVAKLSATGSCCPSPSPSTATTSICPHDSHILHVIVQTYRLDVLWSACSSLLSTSWRAAGWDVWVVLIISVRHLVYRCAVYWVSKKFALSLVIC